MKVFRISLEKWATSLEASGVENRWNKQNEFVIYAGSSRALSTLELVVHRESIKTKHSYKLMVISIKDELDLISTIGVNDLPHNWRAKTAYSELQNLGSKWYHSKESLILKVPSAVIPQESNYLINTQHPLYSTHVLLEKTEDYIWDERLI
jgi:RES domain-containing protein